MPLDITKSIINYTHVDGYKWGSNFLSIDYLDLRTATTRPTSVARAHGRFTPSTAMA